jgi:Ni,Fe-hydrogenase III component G
VSDPDVILETAHYILAQWVWATETSFPEPNRIDAVLFSPDDLIPIVVALRVQRMGYLVAITGLDHGPEEGILEVLYHFCTGPVVVTLRLRLPREKASVPTLTDIIPIAEVFERELIEMMGVTVSGLRNPARLYLSDDWPGDVYPLRKDIDPRAAVLP